MYDGLEVRRTKRSSRFGLMTPAGIVERGRGSTYDGLLVRRAKIA